MRSIYYDGELIELDQGPPAHFQIVIKPDEHVFGYATTEEEQEDMEDVSNISFLLDIVYTDEYPNTLPFMTLVQVRGLEDSEQRKILEALHSCATDSIGMAMVFTLVSTAKEEMENMLRAKHDLKRQIKVAKIQEEEEKERQRYLGTRVTAETFIAWNTKFLKEMAALKDAQMTEQQKKMEKDRKTRLTGRQMFEKDKNLIKSDMAFGQDGDVVVDLELFEEEMAGLDLEDEEELNEVLANFSDFDD